jgi:inosine-uridine nucleoside N-ribohydrolase
MNYKKITTAFSVGFLCAYSFIASTCAAPVKIIFDTDMAEDVDDVGALSILHALADAGEAEILACMISAPHEYVGPCIDVINTYYGRPNIPIGNVYGFKRSYPNDNGQKIPSNYAQKMAETFPHNLQKSSDAPNATTLYRKILAEQPDQSVKIVTVGFLTNLKNLLNSNPDEWSPLNGEQLVKQKVLEWVCMGATFPNRGREYNVMMDTEASIRAINDWPTPVVFSGFEIGVKIFTANALKSKPKTCPSRMGYEWYWNGKENINRESWDLTTVLYAVRGTNNYWTLSEPGKCIMHATIGYGENEWIPYAKGNHRYLIEKMPSAEVGKVIDELLCRDPKYNYTKENGYVELLDGKTMDGWKVTQENSDSWKLVDGMFYTDGPRSHLFYMGNVNEGKFENYILHVEAKAFPGANSGVFIATQYQESGWPSIGYEVQVNNSQPLNGKNYEHKKTGSLYNVRNIYKPLAFDNQWFDMDITVQGNHVQVEVNRIPVVDYIEPASASKLKAGTFALQCHDPKSHVLYRRIAVKTLPAKEVVWAAEPSEKQKKFDKISASGIPLLDLHIHPKGDLNLDFVKNYMHSTGVNMGVAVNCGMKFPITNDFGALQYLKCMRNEPVFLGMQAEGREWVNMFSKEVRSQFDYIFTDSMTITDDKGRRMRLWIPEETFVDEPQEFMDMLVNRIESIMTEPIDIYVNPTYLPASIAQDYDKLWTTERIDRVIAAAKKNNVAIEINCDLKLPKAEFIKKAKAAGLKFTFGTNNTSTNLGDHLAYALQMIEECGLNGYDIWVPGKFPGKQK